MDFLFPFGNEVGDGLLQNTNDGTASVKLSAFFPYFDAAESDIFVSQPENSSTYHGYNAVLMFS